LILSESEPAPYAALAYGCRWRSDFPLNLFHPDDSPNAGADIVVSLGKDPAPERPFHLAAGRLRFYEDGLRYLADGIAIFDIYGQNRIEVTRGPLWAGNLPAAIYGTATAAIFKAREKLVMHGSAVALDGRAVLICGPSGAGKSTLTAALITIGGELISDDLSVVDIDPNGTSFTFSGRRAVRLFPDVAKLLGARVPTEMLASDIDRKSLVSPPSANAVVPYPLGLVLILGAAVPAPLANPDAAMYALFEHLYRRRAFRHLSGNAHLPPRMRALVSSVPIVEFPKVEVRSAADLQSVAEAAFKICKESFVGQLSKPDLLFGAPQ